MNYKAISDMTGLTQIAIKTLEKKGVISSDLTEEHLYFMQNLSKIWGDEELIRLQLSRHNAIRRAKVVFGSGHNRWERAIISQFVKHYSNRDEDKANLHISTVVDEIMTYYSFPVAFRKHVTDTAYKLRRKVCNLIYRKVDLREIGEILTDGKKRKPKTAVKSWTKANQERQNAIFGH